MSRSSSTHQEIILFFFNLCVFDKLFFSIFRRNIDPNVMREINRSERKESHRWENNEIKDE